VTIEPRVVLLAETYHPVLGGGEKHTRSLARGLVAKGLRVQVITRRSSDDLQPLEDDGGVTIHRVGPPGVGRGKKFAMVPAAFALARRLATESDVLMNGGTRVLALPARLSVAGSPCVLVLRPELNGELDGTLALWGRSPSNAERSMVRTLARARNSLLTSAGAVVAISQAIAREAQASGFPASKVHIIPHGIDMATHRPATEAEKKERRAVLGFPLDGVIVTYTGRLIRGKGIETLFVALRALADLKAVHLVLVGSGSGQVISIEDELRQQAQSEGLQGRVTFTGRVDDVVGCLQASDIFAFPTFDESLGMSLVEAQACGLPAVASRTGGVPDVVEDGVTGLLTPPGDAGALASGLRRLIENEELRRAFSTAARSRMIEKFSFETMVGRYVDLFRSLPKRNSHT
jgi:glycosyltransferase involved in cell wall biosynthesis